MWKCFQVRNASSDTTSALPVRLLAYVHTYKYICISELAFRQYNLHCVISLRYNVKVVSSKLNNGSWTRCWVLCILYVLDIENGFAWMISFVDCFMRIVFFDIVNIIHKLILSKFFFYQILSHTFSECFIWFNRILVCFIALIVGIKLYVLNQLFQWWKKWLKII